MRLFGSNCILFCLLLLSSCKSNETKIYKAYNKVFSDSYTHFSNDSLKTYIRFFGDYKENSLDSKNVKKIAHILGIAKSKIEKNAIVLMNTTANPFFSSCILFVTKEEINTANWNKIHINNCNYFQKITTTEQYEAEIIDLNYNKNGKRLLLIIWINHNENKNNVLNDEAEQIFATLKTSINYSNFIMPDPFKEADKEFKSIEDGGNYLKPFLNLKKLEYSYQKDQNKNVFSQALNTYQSFVGIERKSISNKTHSEKLKRLKSVEFYSNEKAYQKLIESCTQNQVIMFNEAHVFPKQRYLVSSLLDTLYQAGFRTLALEAVWKEQENEGIYPNLETGFYLREPCMANLVRYAINLGYKIISYEDTTKVGISNRELNQSLNLINKTIAKNKNEKIIVLAGGSHIKEDTSNGIKKWMATYFKEKTAINPLTINQTAFNNLFFSEDELVLFEGKELNSKIGKEYFNDIYLVNNIKKNKFKVTPNKKDFNLKIKLGYDSSKARTKDLIALIYYEKEFHSYQKIPIFTQLLTNEDDEFDINLPKGNYIVVIKNTIGQTLFEKKYVVSK